MIWEFAMGGNHVKLRVHRRARGRKNGAPIVRGRAYEKVSAFHMPEVCRQIYYETATIGYALNTFLLRDSYSFVRNLPHRWAGKLAPVQLNAITDVGIHPNSCSTYGHGITKVFPAIKRLYLHENALQYPDSKSMKEKAEEIRDRIKKEENRELEIIFYWVWEVGAIQYGR
jgi:hypothetical protein